MILSAACFINWGLLYQESYTRAILGTSREKVRTLSTDLYFYDVGKRQNQNDYSNQNAVIGKVLQRLAL